MASSSPPEGDPMELLAQLVNRLEPGCLLTGKFFVIAEVLDADGDRALWCHPGEGQKAWDTLGLLHWAAQVEQAGMTADAVKDGE